MPGFFVTKGPEINKSLHACNAVILENGHEATVTAILLNL